MTIGSAGTDTWRTSGWLASHPKVSPDRRRGNEYGGQYATPSWTNSPSSVRSPWRRPILPSAKSFTNVGLSIRLNQLVTSYPADTRRLRYSHDTPVPISSTGIVV